MLAPSTLLSPRSPERRLNADHRVHAAGISTKPLSTAACSQEHEAPSLCPDLQSGMEFRDTTRVASWSRRRQRDRKRHSFFVLPGLRLLVHAIPVSITAALVLITSIVMMLLIAMIPLSWMGGSLRVWRSVCY